VTALKIVQEDKMARADKYWWESQKERDHWEDQDVDGWTILKWILER
jgi:hypothetical protein